MSVLYEVGLDVLVCLHFYTVFFQMAIRMQEFDKYC